MARNILVVEDDNNISNLIKMYLDKEGFDVRIAADGGKAVEEFKEKEPDLVLLDVMLPVLDGWGVCAKIRETSKCPIIMLTAKGEEDNKIQGLEVGADDYITKPFSPRELVARLKAVLRRTGPGDSEAPIEVGGLLLDPISHRVTIDGKPAEMGPTEYRLLQFFMTHQERAYTRGQLLDQVWGGNVYVEERTVDVHIRRLRKALGEVYENLVQTVRGTGYRFSTKS